MVTPAQTPLGRFLRQARLTYYKRLADRLEVISEALKCDPEVTEEGDYLHLKFDDKSWRLFFPEVADLIRRRLGKPDSTEAQ